MTTPTLQPLGLGEILDRSVQLFFRAWKPLFFIALVGYIPEVIGMLLAIKTATATSTPLSESLPLPDAVRPLLEQASSFMTPAPEIHWAFTLITTLLAPLVSGALIAASARAYLQQPFTVAGALRAGKERYWRLLGTLIVTGLVIGLPLIVLVMILSLARFLAIPALVILIVAALVYFVFADHTIMLEDEAGGLRPLKRSANLVRGRFWPLLGAGITFGILTSVIDGGATLGIDLILGLVLSGVAEGGLSAFLIAVVNGLVVTVVNSFTVVGLTVVYYDNRFRKEGLDLQMALENPHV